MKLFVEREVPNEPPGQIPLKVHNIEFYFDVSVDSEHWLTVTSKSNVI